MINAKVFLALEESLTVRLTATAKALLAPLMKDIDSALARQDWDGAESLALGINLDAVITQNIEYIDYLAKLAMLFGASRVSKRAKTTAVALGFDTEARAAAVESFTRMVTENVRDGLTAMAVQLIALRRPPVEEAILKADALEETHGKYVGLVMKAPKPKAINPFASFVDKEGKAMFNMVSSLHTSRLSAFGYTAEAKYLGITEYQLNAQLDNRTCPVCRLMHGKVFVVKEARTFLDTVVRTKDPDLLKTLQPWPKQTKANLETMGTMTAAEFVARGWHVPPYHPYCRCLIDKATRVIPLPAEPAPQQAAPQPTIEEALGDITTAEEPETDVYVATEEDFKPLGVNIKKPKVKVWNDIMTIPPAQAVAQLTGQSTASLLGSLEGVENPKDKLGLASLSVTSTGVNIVLDALVPGSQYPVHQDLHIKKDGSLFVGSIEFFKPDVNLFKSVFKRIYGLANATTVNKIKIGTGPGIGGYAFAQYGFSMTSAEWKAVRAQITKNLAAKPYPMSPVVEKAVGLILASDDPKNIWALADIPEVGKALLQNVAWTAILDLEDVEAMTRFLTYMD